MKITEPKTPYVRYNAELDEIEGGTYRLGAGLRASLTLLTQISLQSTSEAHPLPHHPPPHHLR
jgi:Protein phosphatase inhibitor 2 (IPP-2)